MAGRLLERVRLAWPWLAGVVACWAFFVLTPVGQRLGALGMAASTLPRGLLAGPSSQVLDLLTVRSVAGAAIVVLLLGLVGRAPFLALRGEVALLGTVGSAQVIQAALPRPSYGIYPPTNSLPSGHMAVAAGLAMALLIVLPPLPWRRRVAALPAAVVGLAVVFSQAHVFPDVLAAVLLGRFWHELVGARRTGPDRGPAHTAPGPSPRRRHAALGLVAGGAGLLLLLFLPLPATVTRAVTLVLMVYLVLGTVALACGIPEEGPGRGCHQSAHGPRPPQGPSTPSSAATQ